MVISKYLLRRQVLPVEYQDGALDEMRAASEHRAFPRLGVRWYLNFVLRDEARLGVATPWRDQGLKSKRSLGIRLQSSRSVQRQECVRTRMSRA